MRLVRLRCSTTTISLSLTVLRCFSSSANAAILLSARGDVYSPHYGLDPAMGLPRLPSGQSLQLKTCHTSGILGASLWPAAAPLCHHLLQHRDELQLHEKRCMELGAGTGAVGLFAAALGCPSVVLTDCRPLPDAAMYTTDTGNSHLDAVLPSEGSDAILQLLKENVKLNRNLFVHNNVPRVMELDWTNSSHLQHVLQSLQQPTGPHTSSSTKDGFDLILCSDVTHFSAMHQPLASTIKGLLGKTGACLLSHQERLLDKNGRDKPLEDFVTAAQETGLEVERMAVDPNHDDVDNGGPVVAMLQIRRGKNNGIGSARATTTGLFLP